MDGDGAHRPSGDRGAGAGEAAGSGSLFHLIPPFSFFPSFLNCFTGHPFEKSYTSIDCFVCLVKQFFYELSDLNRMDGNYNV